jgi:hypothetical protein
MKVFLFMLVFPSLACLAVAADIDGKWTGEYAGGVGSRLMRLEYTFKADGNTLNGTTLVGQDGEQVPIKNGKIDGNKVSFVVEVEFNGIQLKFDYSGVLSGNELRLSFKTEMPGGDTGGGPGEEMPAQEFIVKKVR